MKVDRHPAAGCSVVKRPAAGHVSHARSGHLSRDEADPDARAAFTNAMEGNQATGDVDSHDPAHAWIASDGSGAVPAGAPPRDVPRKDKRDNPSRSKPREPRDLDGANTVQPLATYSLLSDQATGPMQTLGGAPDTCRQELIAQLTQALNHGVQRLLVLDGQGAGGRAVRMTLNTALLPGATVQVAEVAGCMQATFTFTRRQSRKRLSAGIDALTRQWATSLRRPVRVLLTGQDTDQSDDVAIQADPEQEP